MLHVSPCFTMLWKRRKASYSVFAYFIKLHCESYSGGSLLIRRRGCRLRRFGLCRLRFNRLGLNRLGLNRLRLNRFGLNRLRLNWFRLDRFGLHGFRVDGLWLGLGLRIYWFRLWFGLRVHGFRLGLGLGLRLGVDRFGLWLGFGLGLWLRDVNAAARKLAELSFSLFVASFDASGVASAPAFDDADFLLAVGADEVVAVEAAVVEAGDVVLDLVDDLSAAASRQAPESCEKGGVTCPCRL